MSVSFEVTTNGKPPARYISRACFAQVNQAVSQRDYEDIGSRVRSVKYLPFLNQRFSAEDNLYLQGQDIFVNMTWEIAQKWWDFLLDQEFITSGMEYQRPSTLRGYKDGFTVHADQKADKMMLILFLLRAPQFQAGIVNTWDYLVNKIGVAKDTAFVIAFGINNQSCHLYKEGTAKQRNQRLLTISDINPSESSIVHGEYFTVNGAKMMLNRLLGDDVDNRLYGGKQAKFNTKNCYDRARPDNPKSLSRFFCKQPIATRKNKNFAMYMINDVIGKREADTYNSIGYLGMDARLLSKANILTVAAMLEA